MNEHTAIPQVEKLFDDTRFYKISEAAQPIRKRELFLWRQIRDKKLPAYRFSRHWALLGADLNRWLADHRKAAA